MHAIQFAMELLDFGILSWLQFNELENVMDRCVSGIK